MRRSQPDGNIIGQVVSAQSQNKGVFDIVLGKNRQIGGAAAKIQQGNAQVLFLVGEHGFTGGQ